VKHPDNLGKPTSGVRRILVVALLGVTAPLWLGLLAMAVLAHAIQRVTLYSIVWLCWIGLAPRRILFVYSDSPNWKEHIEQVILPRLPENSVVLNWSQRGTWPRFSVSVWLFHAFAGRREFNPIGLVFSRYRLVARYRFWQPFRDAKHGHPDSLRTLEARFFADLAGQP
jgi:hypothetical protein